MPRSGAFSGLASQTPPEGRSEFQGVPTPDDVERAMAMSGGGFFRLAPGQFTDDAELALSLADALSRIELVRYRDHRPVLCPVGRLRSLRHGQNHEHVTRVLSRPEVARYLRERGVLRRHEGVGVTKLHDIQGERKPDENRSARALGSTGFRTTSSPAARSRTRSCPIPTRAAATPCVLRDRRRQPPAQPGDRGELSRGQPPGPRKMPTSRCGGGFARPRSGRPSISSHRLDSSRLRW